MTTSLWGPDGEWRGGQAPASGPAQTPTPAPGPPSDKAMARVGTGCLVLLGLALLLPALVLTLIAALSASAPATATAPATVLSIEPGVDEDGKAWDHCYTVEYDVDRPRTHRTCLLLPAAKARLRYEPEETEAQERRRFVAEHPVGSTVEVLYEVEDPSRVQGAINDPEVARSGGSPAISAVTGGTALLLLVGSFFAFRGALRAFRAAVGLQSQRPAGGT